MSDVQRGLIPIRDIVLLQAYLHELGYLPDIDGKNDQKTRDGVRRFQRDQGLIADGIAGEKTWTRFFALKPQLIEAVSKKWLGSADIEHVANQLGLPVATVRAVYKVESGGSGFWALRPKILFEGHVFWQQLTKRGKNPAALQAGNQGILFKSWDRTKYVGGPGEYARLAKAQKIDSGAALESASWGMFQIMGYHATGLGYPSVEKYVESMYADERSQLEAFGRFVQVNRWEGKPLLEWLRERNWAKFARAYNGPGYAQNQYDVKLKQAYESALVQQR